MVRKFLIATTALAALATSLPAFAQQADEEQSGIQDIVVTAQRRNESVQDVPIAISAFSSEQLEAQGISNTLQLGQYIPNLFALNNTGLGSANGYYLRGLGNTESIATFDPPVGTYVDDVYLSRQNANNLSLLDVERIEVLRGPQGTLFGRNTTGGAISVIMRDPGKAFGGFAEIGAGRYGKLLVRGSVDAPLSENIALKVSGFSENDKGYVKNLTTGDRLNDSDAWGARLGIKISGSGSFSWKAAVAHLVNNGENVLNFQCDPANSTACNGRFVTTGLRQGNSFDPSPFAPLVITGRKANYGLGNRTANTLLTSNIGFSFGDYADLNLITGYVDLRQQFALDFFDGRGSPSAANPFPAVARFARGGFAITNDSAHKQFTQEVKLSGSLGDGKFDYVTGVFYIHERNTTDFADIFSLSPAVALLLADRTLRNKTEAWAGYLQTDFTVSDQIKLTAGIRYTDETKTVNFGDNRASCNDGTVEITCIDNRNLISLSGLAIPTKQNSKVWTPRFALNFKPNEDLLVFLSATRGFKSGGWNARGTAGSELLPFGPETVWSYEAGIKSDLADKTLRVNITAFIQNTSDLQAPSAFVRANGAIAFITRNFADYENKGIEAELTYAPVEGLNLYTNIGYQNDKYKIDRSAPTLDAFGVRSVAAQQALCLVSLAAGNVPGTAATPNCGAGILAPDGSVAEPVRTPDWSLAIGGSYKAPLGSSGWSITPSINASFASESETGTSNVSVFSAPQTGTNGTFPANIIGNGAFIAGSLSKAHWLVSAGLTVKSPEDALAISVECTNCFNETYVQSSLSNYSYFNRPMEWIVRAKYKF